MLYGIAVIFSALFVLSLFAYSDKLQPTVLAMYSLTSWLMALVTYSHWRPVYMYRYFLYLVSGFFVAAVPFMVVLLAVLSLTSTYSADRKSKVKWWMNHLLAGLLLLFVGVTVWAFWRLDEQEVQVLMSIYINMSQYFVATFLSYSLLNLLISLWGAGRKATNLVVLGSQLDEIDNVTGVLRRRLDKAIRLYHRQKMRTQARISIIVTGGPRPHSDYTEAEGMENYLIQKGISAKDIILEPEAKNTDENVQNVQAIIKQQRLSGAVTVITSRFHLVRSHFIAHKYRFKAYFSGAGTPFYLWPFSIIREYVAFLLLTQEINFALLVAIIIQGLRRLL